MFTGPLPCKLNFNQCWMSAFYYMKSNFTTGHIERNNFTGDLSNHFSFNQHKNRECLLRTDWMIHSDKNNVESISRIHARAVALEGNQEGKTCVTLTCILPFGYKSGYYGMRNKGMISTR